MPAVQKRRHWWCLRVPVVEKHRHLRCLQDACGCLRYNNTSICGACGMPAGASGRKTQASTVPAGCLRVPVVEKHRHRRCLRDASGLPAGCPRAACGLPAGCPRAACGRRAEGQRDAPGSLAGRPREPGGASAGRAGERAGGGGRPAEARGGPQNSCAWARMGLVRGNTSWADQPMK